MAHLKKFVLMTVFLPNLAIAQAVQTQTYNRWLVEQDLPQQRPTARIAGAAQYKQYSANATLARICTSRCPPPMAGLHSRRTSAGRMTTALSGASWLLV